MLHHLSIVLPGRHEVTQIQLQLLLEYCGGGAVDGIMVELSRGLTEPQIQYVMKEILKALDFLHNKYIIHRDLKAGNVLLTIDAQVKLGLFSGISSVSYICYYYGDKSSKIFA